MPGGRPPRREPVSSGMIGGWWSDPIFAKAAAGSGTGVAVAKPPGLGISSSSDIGRYWHDPSLTALDKHTEALRLKNGVKRVYQEQTLSRFPLESLPIEHRLL